MDELIEYKKGSSKLVFNKETIPIEFTETIGKMNENISLNQEKRTKKLISIGKKLFKKHPIIKLRIEKDIKTIFQKDDEELLSEKETIRVKNLYKWILLIYYKNKLFKIGFPYKIKYEEIDKFAYLVNKTGRDILSLIN